MYMDYVIKLFISVCIHDFMMGWILSLCTHWDWIWIHNTPDQDKVVTEDEETLYADKLHYWKMSY